MDSAPQYMPLRMAAFHWLEEQCRIHDDVLPRKLLEWGFPFRGERITLIGQTGIWECDYSNCQILSGSLTISLICHY